MVDIAQKSGLTIDVEKLGKNLGCNVVAVHPRTGAGISELHAALADPAIRNIDIPDIANPKEVNVWANEIVASSVGGTLATGTFTDRLDKAFTHPMLGLITFAVIMSGLFWTIFTLAAFPMDIVETIFGHVGALVGNIFPAEIYTT